MGEIGKSADRTLLQKGQRNSVLLCALAWHTVPNRQAILLYRKLHRSKSVNLNRLSYYQYKALLTVISNVTDSPVVIQLNTLNLWHRNFFKF
jgi:hypothetical protein